MGLAAETGLLVPAKCCMRRVDMVAIGPHTAGLYAAPHPVGVVDVARPDARAEAVDRVIADLDRVLKRLERRHRQHRSEDLLLEDPHFVMAGEHGRLDVKTVLERAAKFGPGAAGQAFGAFLLADVDVLEDLFKLALGALRAHLGGGIERIANLDRGDACSMNLS